MRQVFLAVVGAVLVSATQAQGELPGWRWSGYYTLGHAQVSSEAVSNFARDQTQSIPSAWAVDTRLGLQLDGRLTSTLGVTAQAVLRKRVADTQVRESVEWAFLHWAPAPDWQIRLGRTSPDLFLFADVRSVGVAYPWVRPSQEMYAWVSVQSVDGVDLARTWTEDDTTWKLKGSFGQGRSRLSSQDTGTPGDLRLQAVRTLTLSRESPDSRLKLSYLRSKIDLNRAPVLVAVAGYLNDLAALSQALLPGVADEALALQRSIGLTAEFQYLAAGFQRERGDWQWTGEWSRFRSQAQQNNGERVYLGMAHRFDALSVFGVLGRSRMTEPAVATPLGWQAALTPLVGPDLAAQFQSLALGSAHTANLARVDQRTASVGLRWDVKANVAFKAQLDLVKVGRNGSSLWTFKPGAVEDTFKARVFTVAVDGSF